MIMAQKVKTSRIFISLGLIVGEGLFVIPRDNNMIYELFMNTLHNHNKKWNNLWFNPF